MCNTPLETRTGRSLKERGRNLPWSVKCDDGKTRLLYPDPPPVDWDNITTLMEAARAASSNNLVVGSADWAVFVCGFMKSNAPVE